MAKMPKIKQSLVVVSYAKWQNAKMPQGNKKEVSESMPIVVWRLKLLINFDPLHEDYPKMLEPHFLHSDHHQCPATATPCPLMAH